MAHANILDCPKCSKKALVERRNDLYQCLSCDFKRDLADPRDNKTSSNDFVWVLLLAFIVVLILQGMPLRSSTPHNQPLAPNTGSLPKVNTLP